MHLDLLLLGKRLLGRVSAAISAPRDEELYLVWSDGMKNNVPACDYALDELLAELTETRTLRDQNVETIRDLTRENRQLDMNEAVLRHELERRARDKELVDARTAPEPTPISAAGERCVYCGAAPSRFVKLEPDGPGKFSCVDSEPCEGRI